MKFLSSLTDNIGDRWRALPKTARGFLTVALVAGLAVLPMVQIPILDTPQTDFPSLLFDKIGLYVLMGIGLNVVVGKAGLLDLGYVAFFAIGGYTMAQIGTLLHWSFWVILPLGIAIAMTAGVILGLTHAAASRRLSGNRHAWIRGDHPNHRSERRLAWRKSWRLKHPLAICHRPTEFRGHPQSEAVLLGAARADHPRHLVAQTDRPLTSRPCLGGH